MTSLSCQGKTWQYSGLRANWYTRRRPRDRPGRSLTRNRRWAPRTSRAITVTTPTGGWVQYISRKHLDQSPIGYDPRWDSYTLRSRQSGGTGVAGGTWQFTYPSDGTPTTTIDGTSGVTYHARTPSATTARSGRSHSCRSRSAAARSTKTSTVGWQGGRSGPRYGVSLSQRAVGSTSRAAAGVGVGHTRGTDLQPHVPGPRRPISTTSASRPPCPGSGELAHRPPWPIRGSAGPPISGIGPYQPTVDGVAGSLVYDPNTGFVPSRTAAGSSPRNSHPTTTGTSTFKSSAARRTLRSTTSGASSARSPRRNRPGAATVNPDGSVATASENGHTTVVRIRRAGRLTGVHPPSATRRDQLRERRTCVHHARGTPRRRSAWTDSDEPPLRSTARGHARIWSPDAFGRVVRQSLPYTTTPPPSSCSSAPASAPPSVRLHYDALGRVTTRTNADGTYVTYAYDSTPENSPIQGLRTTITEHPGGTTPDRTTAQILQASGSPSNSRLASVTNADGRSHPMSTTARAVSHRFWRRTSWRRAGATTRRPAG